MHKSTTNCAEGALRGLPCPEPTPTWHVRCHPFAGAVVVGCMLVAWVAGTHVHAGELSLVYRGTFSLPGSTVDQFGNSFDINGLSGITWAGGSTFWAVMDNSNKLIQLDVSFHDDATVLAAAVIGGLALAQSRDFEGIAYTDAVRNSVFLSDETMPAMGLREFSLADGALLQTVAVPEVFNTVRSNYGLESLTRRRGGQVMWTANEEALTVDGSLSSTTSGSVVRLQQFDVTGDQLTAARQWAYVTEPVHRDTNDDPTQTGALSRSGLVELVALPDGRLLALERSFALAGTQNAGSQYRNSIFLLDFAEATDVSGFDAGLIGQTYEPVEKTLLWQATRGVFWPDPIGNLEGLALGPQLAGGNHVLLGIVDWPGEGSIDVISANRLVAFELVGTIPEPATPTLLLMGVAVLSLRRSRRRVPSKPL